MLLITVYKKGSGVIDYNIETGLFIPSAPGWFGPENLNIVGAYAVVKPKESYQEFVNKILKKIEHTALPPHQIEEIKEHIIKDSYRIDLSNLSDLYWIYLGNANYFYLTGRHGEEPPWDHYLLDEDELDDYTIEWDDKEMDKWIDKLLVKLGSGKSPSRLASDSKKNWLETFIEYLLDNMEFKKVEL